MTNKPDPVSAKLCVCGHRRDEHYIEQPYPCHGCASEYDRDGHESAVECECEGFTIPRPISDVVTLTEEQMRKVAEALESAKERLNARAEQGFDKWRDAVAKVESALAILQKGEKL